MLIAFTLSMPCNNAWNGRWSGEQRRYCLVKSIRSQKTIDRVLAYDIYKYAFGDGWVAAISVEVVDTAEARRLRKLSDGFCGYDWMVESIILNGVIQSRTQHLDERAKKLGLVT